jgi:hypothetical protein
LKKGEEFFSTALVMNHSEIPAFVGFAHVCVNPGHLAALFPAESGRAMKFAIFHIRR